MELDSSAKKTSSPDAELIERLVRLKVACVVANKEAEDAAKAATEAVIRRNRTRKAFKKAQQEWVEAVGRMDGPTYDAVALKAYTRTGRTF